MTEHSVNSIPSVSEDGEITLPEEGDVLVEGDKSYVWTKVSSDPHVSVYEWVEKKSHHETTYDSIYY